MCGSRARAAGGSPGGQSHAVAPSRMLLVYLSSEGRKLFDLSRCDFKELFAKFAVFQIPRVALPNNLFFKESRKETQQNEPVQAVWGSGERRRPAVTQSYVSGLEQNHLLAAHKGP